jgi:hypothetical protein
MRAAAVLQGRLPKRDAARPLSRSSSTHGTELVAPRATRTRLAVPSCCGHPGHHTPAGSKRGADLVRLESKDACAACLLRRAQAMTALGQANPGGGRARSTLQRHSLHWNPRPGPVTQFFSIWPGGAFDVKIDGIGSGVVFAQWPRPDLSTSTNGDQTNAHQVV